MAGRLKVGVIGVGYLGKFHARILAGQPDVELVGVVDSHAATAQQIAAQYNTQAYTDFRLLLPHIDAAVLAVPTRYHHPLGMLLISHGIHVLIEKPLATTASQAQELVECAQRQGVLLACGHVERFNPAWAAAQHAGRDPKYIEASRLGAYTFRSTDIGVVLDLMIHDLDLILSLVKQPVDKVEALGISIFGKHEDIANARLTFAGGCVATLNASRASFAATRTMQIWSPSAYVGIDFASRSAKIVKPSDELRQCAVKTDGLTPAEQDVLKQKLFQDYLRLEQTTAEPCDQLTEELLDFVSAIRTGTQVRASGLQGCAAVTLAERVLAKIETHSWGGSAAPGLRGPLAGLTVPPLSVAGPHFARVPATVSGQKN